MNDEILKREPITAIGRNALRTLVALTRMAQERERIERWRLTERRFHVEGSLILDEADDIERTIDGLLVDFGRLAELQARMEYGAS